VKTRLVVFGGLWLWAIALHAQAQPWQFAAPLQVTGGQPGVFHHLESSGRRNIAVSDGTVAVAWEDNRDGTPRVYLARKRSSAGEFSPAIQISGSGEAFEPSLLALDQQRFVLAWEEDAKIHARVVTASELGPVLILNESEAMQASLTSQGKQVLLVYARHTGRFSQIWSQAHALDGLHLLPGEQCAVDSAPVKDDQLYPTAVSLADAILVAWEDRRPGHTIIMAAKALPTKACQFTPPQRISEGRTARNPTFGKGHGVARVALAGYGVKHALAVWADKRDFREGYDIYAADYQSDNKLLFGVNQKVQDSFGGVAQQWHASVAGDLSGRLVVAWDDNRDGNANVMLSWREQGEWSDDLVVPGAGGPGQQTHPSVTLDAAGNLHLAWVERASINGTTTLRYVFGRAAKAP
jgi:hypothetical protein